MFCKKLTAAAAALALLTGIPAPVLPVQPPMTASAESVTGSLTDTITYTIDGDTLTLTGTGATGTFNYYNGFPDYRRSEDIRHVIVEEGITELGHWTFELPNLQSISLPDSIETLDDNIIYDSYQSQTLLIGSEGSAAQTYAQAHSMFFQNAKTGEIADITGSYTDTIGYVCSYADRTLTVTGTGEIPDYGSGNSKSPVYSLYFESIVIGEGITRIGDRAFAVANRSGVISYSDYGTSAVQQVILPDSLRSVGETPFGSLPDTWVTVEDGCRYFGGILIGTETREDAAAPLTVLEGTQHIAESAFGRNDLPESVTLPESIRSVGSLPKCLVRGTSDDGAAAQYAASHCLLFENVNTGAITEPSGVCGAGVTYRLASDGTLTIEGTGPMTNYVYVNNPDDDYVWGYPLDDSLDWLDLLGYHPFSGNSCIRHIVVAPGVKTLGDFAFIGLPNLETLTIPDTVTRIGGSCIMNCPKLSSLDIPESVTVIAEWSSMPMSYAPFEGCDSLTDIHLPPPSDRARQRAVLPVF